METMVPELATYSTVNSDSLKLIIRSRLFTFEGVWCFEPEILGNVYFSLGLPISYDYLITVQDGNCLVYPDDLQNFLAIFSKEHHLQKLIDVRLIMSTGEIKLLRFKGKFVGAKATNEDGAHFPPDFANGVLQNLREESKLLMESIIQSDITALSVLAPVYDTKGDIVDFEWVMANKLLRAIASGQNVVGKKYSQVFTSFKTNRVFDFLKKAFISGERSSHEVYYQDQNIRGWFRQVYVRNGDLMLVSAEDITSAKKAEEALKEQAHFITSVIETIPDMLSVINLSTLELEYINQYPIQTNNVSAEKLLSMSRAERRQLIHPDDLDKVDAYFDSFRNVADDRISTMEYRAQNDAADTWQWFRAHGRVFRRDKNNLPTHCVNVIQNITTERKSFEEIIRMKETTAENAEMQYQQLFSSIDQGFVVLEIIESEDRDVDFRFHQSNPAFEHIANTSDLQGKSMRERLPRAADSWFFALHETVKSKQHRRIVLPSLSTEDRWFDVYAFPTGPDDSGKVAVLLTDITERLAQENQLKELNRKLREMDKAKTKFFSNVSHEFRTPLTLILGPLQDVIENGGTRMDANDLQKLLMIQRNSKRLGKLVNNLLDFSRIEAEKMDAVYQPVNISQFTAELASNFESLMEKAGLRYNIKCQPISESVYLNREMWQKIVFNLLSNAFKFTHSGKIDVVLREKKKNVSFEVHDTGIGIVQEKMSQIFERFVRIDDAKGRAYEGTGIGLSLVQELVRLHGGTIKVKSEVGKGSTFYITIPKGKSHLPPRQIFESTAIIGNPDGLTGYADEMVNWLPQLQKKTGSAKIASAPKGKSILIADDNADMRNYLIAVLTENFNITAVENGHKVLECLANGMQPDLILSDVMMPGLNGVELVNMLKSNESYSRIPIVLLSARSGEEAKVEGIESGADDYLTKPFSRKELLTLIQSRIKIAQLRDEAEQQLAGKNQELELRVKEKTSELEAHRIVIEKQNAYLESILDAIPQMVWVLDPDGHLKFINSRWLSYSNLVKENCMQLDPMKCGVFHPSQHNEIVTKWDACVRERKRYINEVLVRDSEGDYQWHLNITEPVVDGSGELLMWISTFTNINEQVLIENEVKESRDLMQTVFNASTNAISVLETVIGENEDVIDFRWQYFNDQTTQFFGSTLEAVTIGERLTKPEGDELISKLKAVIATGKPVEFEHILHVNDTRRWLQTIAVKLGDDVVVTQQDITDRVLARQKLVDLNESLKQKNLALKSMNEELANFAFIASHDLREPLRKIQLFTNELIDHEAERVSTKARDYVTKIISAVNRMNALIDDVLTFSKVSSVKPSEHSVVDLNEPLQQALDSLEDEIAHSGAVIEYESLPELFGNKLQFSQLLENLIHNAVKFQPENQRPVVKITAQFVAGNEISSPMADTRKRYLCLSVSDNGIGFESEYTEKIFHMFQRLHGRTEYPGTGMGLALCKRIVENHQGFIVAKGTLGNGSTFTCYFPIIN